MTPIADMVSEMLAAGIPHDAIVLAIATAEKAAAASRQVDSRVDTSAEKRREWDRNYRRAKRSGRVESTRHPPDIHPTPENAISLTTLSKDTEKEKKERGRQKRTRPIPPDWQPPERARELARELGVDLPQVEGTFRDYCAASGKLYADHDAAFCNFIRNSRRFGGSNGPGPGNKPQTSGNVIEAADRLVARMREFDRPAPSRRAAEDGEGNLCFGTGTPPLRAIPKG